MRKRRTITAFAVALVFAVCALACFLGACKGNDADTSVENQNAGRTNTYTEPSETPVGITLSDDRIVFGEGGTASVKAEVTTEPTKKYDGFVTWESSEKSVATVTNGNIAAVSPGITYVTASAEADGAVYTAECKVIVTDSSYDNNHLKVGIKDDVEGFGYDNPVSMTYEGAEIELAYYIAEEMLCPRDDVELIALESSQRETALDDGTVDYIVATYTITEERSKEVNFSSPYYEDYVQVLVGEKYTTNAVTTVEKLSEYVYKNAETCLIGTVAGTTAYDAFTEYCSDKDIAVIYSTWDFYENVEYGATFATDENGDPVEVTGAYKNAWDALVSGEIWAFIGDHSILSSYAKGSYNCSFLTDRLSSQQYGVATAKGSDITETVNGIVDAFLEDGTIATILDMYGLEYTVA